MTDWEKSRALVERLIEEYPKDDPDFKAAEGYLDAIKELFIGCYSYSDLCEWLAEHNFDILENFRYANFESYEDFEWGYPTFEEWKQDNADYIDGKTEEEQREAYEDEKETDWRQKKEDALIVRDDEQEIVESW